jgi:hypothetical protein
VAAWEHVILTETLAVASNTSRIIHLETRFPVETPLGKKALIGNPASKGFSPSFGIMRLIRHGMLTAIFGQRIPSAIIHQQGLRSTKLPLRRVMEFSKTSTQSCFNGFLLQSSQGFCGLLSCAKEQNCFVLISTRGAVI